MHHVGMSTLLKERAGTLPNLFVDPYRSAEPARPICVVCETEAEAVVGGERCARCGRHFCMAHVLARGERCESCNLVYERRRRGIRYWAWALCTFVPVLLFWIWWGFQIGEQGTYLWLPVFDATVSVFCTWLIVCGTLVGLRVLATRARFLAERYRAEAD